MSTQSSVWIDFLEFCKKDQLGSPIVYSLIKQLHPVEITDNSAILTCNNPGLKQFLDKKLFLIEKNLYAFSKKTIAVEIVLVEKIQKKEKPAPLLSFQRTIGDILLTSGIHNKYRFDNFAVSPSNQVAYAAAQAVAKDPGNAYNPLFIYGGVGVGKTHLAQAAARTILEHNPETRVFFSPGDQFTNELIESIRERSTSRFRKKYRYLKALTIDDVQFIAGKEYVQEEFFHTFNSIVSAGGQIILTADRSPQEIKGLEDRLRSRFSGGLLVDVQPPDFELRTAILLIKAKEKNIEIEIGAARSIAEQIGDSRALEGTLLSIYARVVGKKEIVDFEEVELFFQEKTKNQFKKTTPHEIIKIVCSYYNVKQSLLKGPERSDRVAVCRQIVMFLLRKELGLKLEEIAYLLHKKDHTTVIHGINKISNLLIKDQNFKQEVDRITSSFIQST